MNYAGKFDNKLTFDGPGSHSDSLSDFLGDFLGSHPHSVADVHVATATHAPADAIIVPDAQLLFHGDFHRSGVDLILSKDDHELVLHNYFKGEKRVALSSPDGAHLTGDIISALTGYQQFAQADGSASVSHVIGHVSKLVGTATAIRNGVSIILNNGDNVEKGDVVESGAGSTLGITFIDGTVFGLSSNAKMVLNEMVYDPNGSNNSSLISLVAGTISFVAGETAKHGDMKVDTPVATMGIRGTAVLVEIDFSVPGQGGAPAAQFQVLVEPDGTTGSYILFDKTTLAPLWTVNQAGQAISVNNGNVSVGTAQLSPEIQKLITDVFAQKFTDNSNPNTKTADNHTDSLTPQTQAPIITANGLIAIPLTVTVNTTPGGLSSADSKGPINANPHIAGPPRAVVVDSSGIPNTIFTTTELAGKTGDTAPDTATGQVNFVDVNAGDTPTVSTKFDSFSYHSNNGAALNALQLADIKAVEVDLLVKAAAGNNNNGSATWTYNVPDNAFDFLAAGETLTLTYIARVDNNYAANDEVTNLSFTITITGTNDVPVITSTAPTIAFSGGTSVSGGNLKPNGPTSGTLSFNDVDLTDTHTVTTALTGAVGVLNGATVLNGVDALPPGPLAILETAVSASIAAGNDSTGKGAGTINWTLADLPVYIADFIPKGETLTLTYTVTLTDSQGAPTTQNVIVTITGTDAAAVVWISTGSTTGGLWSQASNWETGTVPTATDDAIIITDQLHGLTPSYPVIVDDQEAAKTVTMNDFDVSNPSHLQPKLVIKAAGTLTIGGTFALNADASVDNSGTVNVGGKMELLDTSVLTNSGTLKLAQGGDFKTTNTISNTITGKIEVSGGALNVQVGIANSGQIIIDSAATLTLTGATVTAGTVTNNGTLDLTGTAVLKSGTLGNTHQINVTGSGNALDKETVTNSGGIDVSGALTIDQVSTVDNTGGTITVDSSGTLTLNAATVTAGTVTNNGTLEATSGTDTISGVTSFTNNGTLEAISGATLVLSTETVANGSGTVTVGSGSTLDLESANITGGTITDHGLIDVKGSSTISNAHLNGGNLTIESAQTLTLTGATVTDTAISFAGTGDTLKMDAASSYNGTISGLVTGDIIDLTGTTVSTAVWNGSTLALNGVNTSFQISGLPSGDTFAFKSDGQGGTELEVLAQTLTVGSTPAAGVEGTGVPLHFSDTLTGGASLTSFVISAIPNGAILSDGTHTMTVTTGTLDVAGWNLANLTITPANDSNFVLSAMVTSTDANGFHYTVPATEAVTVSPTAPTLTWNATASGTEAQVALGSLAETITGLTGDNNSNSANTLTISGAPQGAVLSDGAGGHSVTSNGTAIDVSGWTLSSLTINTSAATVPDGNFTLTATATEKDSNGDVSTKGTATESVTVTPTAPTLTWATSVSGTEAQIALGNLAETITGLPGDNNSANTLTIGGAPAGAVLSDGHGHSMTSDGSAAIDVSGWTLSGLTINTTGVLVPDGNFTLTATATEKDGNSDVSTSTTAELVTVNPTAPTVVPVTVSGLQGTPIALNLGIATTNLTGDSNTLNSVTISSIPTGATLSNSNGALTFSGGSITFDATQLANGALNGLKITAANNANFTLHVSAQQKDADGDLSNVARGSEAVTLPGYLWGTAVIQEPNSHLFNPIGNFDSAANTGALLFGTSPSSGFNATSPSVTMNVGLFDPFVLPYRSGKQQIETSTTDTPFKYQVMMPVTASGPEAVAFYSTETNGVSTIYQSIVSETAGGPNGSLTIGAPTALEQNLSGGLNTLYTSYTNVNASDAQTATMTSYSVAWGVYNGSTYQAQFQIFPTIGPATGVVTIESLSGLASAALAPAWEFRSAGGLSDHGASVPYASVVAVADGTQAGRQDIQFQGYNANGSANADVAFLITPDLTNFLAGATNQITQPSNGATLLFTPNGVADSGFSVGWSETVTDANGIHNQVEFAVFKPSGFASPANGGTFGSGALISKTTFQVPDAQNIRIGSSSVGGASVEYLAYGDNNSTTVVEFDQNGHQIASITDTSHVGVTYNDFEIMGDGRIVLTYDDNTQYTADIFDLRQTGLNNPTLSTTSANYIAGTHFADSVTGANGVNNFYDFIGSQTTTPTDSFTGGTGGFNEAVFTDARSDFTITLTGGTTVQSNDSAHGGTLDTSNVQALAFGVSHDPSPSSTGGLEVTNGETLVMLSNLGNTHPVTIDTGGTLEITATGSAEAATFAATGATLQLDKSQSYTGTVSGFITGDTIDLTDITYSTTVTDIWNSANNTLTISNGAHSTTLTFAGSYTQDSFALKQDSGTGTEVVLTTVAHDDTIANASPPSGAGWVLDPANGHYYREVTTHGTFGAAVAGAAADGGYLATITSADEQAFVVNHVIGGLDATWLGGETNNDRPDGSTVNASTWTWVTGPEAGTQFTYTNWNSGEPSGGFGATTQYLEIGPTGGWNDAPDAFQSGNGAGAGYLEEWGGLQNQIAFNENTGTTIAASVLLANDTDPNGGTLSITAVGGASAHGGTVSLDGNVITYTPTANYFGADSFTYTVSDGALTSTATVSFNVAPLAPVNLLANGGFETGNFSGWTVGGDNAPRSAVIGSGAHQATGDAPHHGSNEALIGGAESDVTLSHTVATAAGDHYTVDFWLANSAAATPGEGNDFSVSWNGVSLMSTIPNAGQSGYTEYQFDVVGAAGQSTLQFTALNENGFWNLDDVSVREGAPSTVRDVVDQTDPMAGVQSGDTLSVAANGNGYLGTLTAAPTAAGTFEWHFTATNNQLDHLTAQTQTYTVTDQSNNAVAAQTVSVSIGGPGNDQFIFNANSNHHGADMMVNFSTASSGNTYVGDTVELDHFNGINSVNDVLAHLSADSHNNAVVDLGNGDSITFQGISVGVIQANAAHLFTFHA